MCNIYFCFSSSDYLKCASKNNSIAKCVANISSWGTIPEVSRPSVCLSVCLSVSLSVCLSHISEPLRRKKGNEKKRL
jgi:hypothetical protein